MSTPQEAITAPPKATSFLKDNLRDFGMLISLVVIVIFFQIATDGVLLKPLNVTNIVLQNSYIVIMALGMLMVIVTGHIDLSVGSVAGFIGGLAGLMMVSWGINFAVVIVACLAVGGLIGAAQGYFVAYLKIPSFIVTLAGMLVFRGLMIAILGSQAIGPFPPIFQKLSSGYVVELISSAGGLYITSFVLGLILAIILIVQNVASRKRRISHGVETEPFGFFVAKNLLILAGVGYIAFLISSHRGMPNVLIIMAVLIAAYSFLTTRTVVGRQIYAVGGNARAAELSGIKTTRLVFLTFVNMGMLAALGGLVVAARLNSATPKAGTGFELDVIAACFIGGASAYGGVGKVTGAVIGAFLMGVMNNGMSILGIGIDYQQVIKGLVLLGAVCVDVYNQRR
ncbi:MULTISPECIES: multiple monosaccharide ABC transporter permease [Rhizobium/Agrobacterium group]|uniref:Xylose transport system permease protein XylH n=2 Tax=Neorhizobium TaxID=1525371 RepID=A0ABV0M3G0_9HYPH|nr:MULTISPECIES: multiple monosaccharide ABC transporter permease [Rhizobium/Agrobacterium group]KGE00892.1 ABC transporter permease [Rhizobium sp. YS-1r]MCC2610508.1 sugar ABC transporter permease [Neorhizobium petrolearium]WGI70649.1 sugar ABC transporter permease [Neorhizobium petrolearium]